MAETWHFIRVIFNFVLRYDGTIIKEPAVVRELRYSTLRKDFLGMCFRATALTLVISTLFLGSIWLRAGVVPLPIVLIFSIGAALLPAVLLIAMIFAARFEQVIWSWDDAGLTISNHRYRWTSFQRFELVKDSKAVGIDTFRIQFRNRILSRGMWLGITAYRNQLEGLVGAAVQRIPKRRQGE